MNKSYRVKELSRIWNLLPCFVQPSDNKRCINNITESRHCRRKTHAAKYQNQEKTVISEYKPIYTYNKSNRKGKKAIVLKYTWAVSWEADQELAMWIILCNLHWSSTRAQVYAKNTVSFINTKKWTDFNETLKFQVQFFLGVKMHKKFYQYKTVQTVTIITPMMVKGIC